METLTKPLDRLLVFNVFYTFEGEEFAASESIRQVDDHTCRWQISTRDKLSSCSNQLLRLCAK